jgi:5'-methylthioadenosine phosphorylase
MTRAALALLLFALGAVSALAVEESAAPKDMVMLTVAGAIANTNRGPLDPKRDSLFALKGISFDRAFAFDRAMLLGLKQGTVKAQTAELGQPATFTGPLLKEVLATVGAARAKVSIVAVDGYTGWLSPEDIEAGDWIVALAADGVSLGLGQQGPVWLLNTRKLGESPSTTQEGHWVWSTYFIKGGVTIMTRAVLGIIGGSGLYDLPGLGKVREERVGSPWGEPSAPLRIGEIAGLPIVFMSRHDKGHRLSPSDINYRANIDVMKRAGVTDLVSLSACGSFKEELPPGTFVLVDQFVDRTFARASSFFGTGCVAHVSMAHPVSPRLRLHLAEAAEAEGIRVARGGTYVCMEGPQFSTLAESLTYKDLGYSVIGMTNLPEAKLAREAEICYATVAMVTDFDCWHPDHDAVTVTDIIKVLLANAEKAAGLVARLARDFPREHEPCPIGSDRALDTAIITAPEARDPELLKKLDAVAGRVLGQG